MSNTPNKIYIPGKWLCVPKNHFETEDSPGATEYIRKEVILEWLNEKHKDLDPPCSERGFGRLEAIEALIDKINSL